MTKASRHVMRVGFHFPPTDAAGIRRAVKPQTPRHRNYTLCDSCRRSKAHAGHQRMVTIKITRDDGIRYYNRFCQCQNGSCL